MVGEDKSDEGGAAMPRRPRFLLPAALTVIMLAMAALVVLFGLKILDLSEKVALLSTTTVSVTTTATTTPPTSTSTASSPWASVGGSTAWQAYTKAFEGVAYNRNYYVEDWNKKVEGGGWNLYTDHATKRKDLINQVRKLPVCPAEIKKLQDAYVDVLVDQVYALEARARGDAGSNDDLNGVHPREFKAWLAWTDALRRYR